MPIYEFCAENVTFLEKAFEAGAQRVLNFINDFLDSMLVLG